MTNQRKSKRGMVTIFIMIFFVSLVTLIFAFISASKELSIKSSSEALFKLWGNSVLAEFDLNLQRRYNIFGFYGITCDIEEKLDFYAENSFSDKKYIDYDGCSCSLYDYSLINSVVFRKQIAEAAKFDMTKKAEDREEKPVEIVSADKGKEIDSHRDIFDFLPSQGSDSSISISGLASKLKGSKSFSDIAEKGTDIYFENQYLFTYFKNAVDSHNLGETFFDNEVEYIICGKRDDSDNLSAIRNRIIGVREILNFSYLHKDKVKMAEATAAAALITPGPAAILTRELLLAAWALAESINDYKLLINGYKVALIKSERSWAVDLDSVINNREEDCIYTGDDTGQNYEEYLTLFAMLMDDDMRALRMMDIIQINMRYFYYDDFRLRDYNGGLRFTVKVNGKSREYEAKY